MTNFKLLNKLDLKALLIPKANIFWCLTSFDSLQPIPGSPAASVNLIAFQYLLIYLNWQNSSENRVLTVRTILTLDGEKKEVSVTPPMNSLQQNSLFPFKVKWIQGMQAKWLALINVHLTISGVLCKKFEHLWFRGIQSGTT